MSAGPYTARVPGALPYILPALIGLAHLVGGASDPVSAAWLTTLLSCAALAVIWAVPQPYSAAKIRWMAFAGLPFSGLLALVALSIIPGSDRFASGSPAHVVGAATLSLDSAATMVELMKLGGLAVVFIAAERLATSPRMLQRSIWSLIAAGTIWAVASLILLAQGASTQAASRLSGAFVSPNIAGALLAMTLLLLLGEIVLIRSPRRQLRQPPIWALALMLLFVAAIGLTASRATVVLALALGTALWVWRRVGSKAGGRREQITPKRVAVLVATVALTGTALLGGAGVLQRLDDTGADATDRMAIAGIYAKAAREAPVLGHGLGSAPALSRLLITPQNDAFFWNIRAAHNVAVQWWVETGILGTLLMASCLVLLIGPALKSLAGVGRGRLAGPGLALVFLGLHSLVDYAVQIYSIALFAALVLGLCFGAVGQRGPYWACLDKHRAVISRGRRG